MRKVSSKKRTCGFCKKKVAHDNGCDNVISRKGKVYRFVCGACISK